MLRPSFIAQLKKGFLIDTCMHFVDTFNWMANFLYRLRCQDGSMTLDETTENPTLKLVGFESAEDGNALFKEGGSLAWKDVEEGDTVLAGTNVQISVDEHEDHKKTINVPIVAGENVDLSSVEGGLEISVPFEEWVEDVTVTAGSSISITRTRSENVINLTISAHYV